MWIVEYKLYPHRNKARFFGTEEAARAAYRGLWNAEGILEQSVGKVDYGFSLLSVRVSDLRKWVVRIRMGGKIHKITCGTRDLWNVRSFLRLARKQAGITLPAVKSHEWKGLLEYIADRRRSAR